MTIQTPSPPGPPLAPVPYQPTSPPPAPPTMAGAPQQHRGRWIALIVVVALITVGAIAAIIEGPGKTSRPAAPTQLRAMSVTATTVTIGWTPAASTTPTLFRVYRNGHLVHTLSGHIVRFTDNGLAPSTAYRYQVSAYDKNWSALSSTLVVTTGHASLGAARLLGTSQYAVKVRITSEYGYTSIAAGDHSRQEWWFNVKRAAGRYVLLGNLSGGSFKMPIRQHGVSFAGTTHETLSSCSYVPVNTAVRLTFRALKASTVNGVWGVTRFSGTLRQTAPATTVGLMTCSGAGYTATVTGHVVR